MPKSREESIGEHFRCDAGHSDGEPCTRPVHVRKGRVALCGEHMDALRFGLEADEFGQAAEQIERWMAEEPGEYLAGKLAALLEEVTGEYFAKRQQAERFLKYADA